MNPALGLSVLRRRAAAAAVPRIAAARQARSYATKQPSPVAQFYKTFTRPIGKVLVLAVFTYQVAYWTWTKLEADEHRAEADATIAALESTVNEYKKTKDGKKDMP
ncbi:hypothetical protein N5P37_009072 [Trichoderma harzianum]|uniref:Uncharacterized protein n=1 Tax=Trichoderma harzianum CBS 226.95 TaxID=983964 RepID=A0A2T4A632_TRIHA|nr:hypothetical protein M431DRAFT_509818 [Trichoderma harzianum CBS 226.95]KAK0758673.1 hypothetical protein N5P37_009072 [Trichoderma harzianum]PKK52940.1 hypothetical protein CI102_2229 [Trichoderma harzianum]PTB52545.1 hypothetical protein M431DRAFT_509818 [Trichoderma harzianum CBS 226.95]